MPKAVITIEGQELEIEYEFKITYRGSPTSYDDPGDPAEFEIEDIGPLRFSKQAADVPDLEMPTWLKDLITAALYEHDDVNELVQNVAMEPDDDYD